MAFFGVPVVHEDHAQRALQAALDLRRRLHERVALFPAVSGQAWALRVGIHTGRVVGVWIGEDRPLTYLALGDTMCLATHLQQMAEPNAIVVSDATTRLVQDAVRLDAFSAAPLPGQSGSVTAYKVRRAPLQRTLWSRRRQHPRRPCVGREGELALLQELLERATRGQGQVVGIVGEPGIGKSRLLAEFQRRIAGQEVTYLQGRCLP